ncbi:golgin subfamily A member 6-like protein 22 [Silurus meridionalis]|uniref:golgin subfamily A member 6-like protein 22 n=1 Tax=Silurus meridionalis TaxID=175797 RepID=UPI001EEB4289|nr:golgin subfamily A member 6-like protein 22 [Silurus meridionalis]
MFGKGKRNKKDKDKASTQKTSKKDCKEQIKQGDKEEVVKKAVDNEDGRKTQVTTELHVKSEELNPERGCSEVAEVKVNCFRQHLQEKEDMLRNMQEKTTELEQTIKKLEVDMVVHKSLRLKKKEERDSLREQTQKAISEWKKEQEERERTQQTLLNESMRKFESLKRMQKDSKNDRILEEKEKVVMQLGNATATFELDQEQHEEEQERRRAEIERERRKREASWRQKRSMCLHQVKEKDSDLDKLQGEKEEMLRKLHELENRKQMQERTEELRGNLSKSWRRMNKLNWHSQSSFW